MSALALSGVKVVDLTHRVAGPYCTKLLAALGAEVIKVERPDGGDPARSLGPFCQNEPGPDRSALFLYLNTSKKSITLNLKTATGKGILKKLVEQADIVVESFSPRVMPGLGLDYGELEKVNPKLVMTSISNFGQSGPYRDSPARELEQQAISGLMYITGEPEREPLKMAGYLSQYIAGQNAFTATVGGLYLAGEIGVGEHLDVSIVEANMSIYAYRAAMPYLYRGSVMKRLGNRHANHPAGPYPCKDGFAGVIASPEHRWPAMAGLFDEPRLSDPKYGNRRSRGQHADEIDALIMPWLKERGKKEVYHAGQAAGLAFGYVANSEDLLTSHQLWARDYFVDIDHPVVGTFTYPGPPFKVGDVSCDAAPAPLLGQHNEEVLCEQLGYRREDLVRLRERGIV